MPDTSRYRRKDHPDPFGFLLDDDQLAILQRIAGGRGPDGIGAEGAAGVGSPRLVGRAEFMSLFHVKRTKCRLRNGSKSQILEVKD